MKKNNGTLLLLLPVLFSIFLVSCAVAVPTGVKPQVTRSDVDERQVDSNMKLTLTSRKLLDDVKKYINEAHKNIVVVDGFLFRDTAFRDTDNTLGELLSPESCDRIANELKVDYLVVLNPLMARSVGDDEGFFVPMLAGAMSSEHESRITSMIVDLRTGEVVCNIRSSAIGRDRMLYYVIFIAGNEAQTDDSAVKGLSAEIGNAINDHNKHKNTRIAIMTNEVFKDITDTSTLDEIWGDGYEYNPPEDAGAGYSELDLCTFADKELIKQIHIWDEEGELVLGAHGKWINAQTRESAVQECKIKLSSGTHMVHYTVRLKPEHGNKVQIEPRGNINFIAGHTYAVKLNYGGHLQASEYSSWIEDTSTHKIELGCEKRSNYQCPSAMTR